MWLAFKNILLSDYFDVTALGAGASINQHGEPFSGYGINGFLNFSVHDGASSPFMLGEISGGRESFELTGDNVTSAANNLAMSLRYISPNIAGSGWRISPYFSAILTWASVDGIDDEKFNASIAMLVNAQKENLFTKGLDLVLDVGVKNSHTTFHGNSDEYNNTFQWLGNIGLNYRFNNGLKLGTGVNLGGTPCGIYI